MATIVEWLSRYKPNTKQTYQSALFLFLDHINGSPVRSGYVTDANKKKYEKIAAEHLIGGDFGKDIEGFIKSLEGKPPKTVKVYVAAIREWLIYNRVQLTDFDKREIKRQLPKGGAVSFEAELDHEKIRLLLAHADSSWIRAIIIMLASSGMRINEVLTLTPADIERTGKCWRVKISGKNTKSREKRYTFISSEAVASLQAWELERTKYLNGKGDDERIFPMSDENVRVAFGNVLKKAGIFNQDKDTKRSDLTPHAFRKFFLSQIKIGMPSEVAELLAGHNGYLSDAYRRYSVQQVRELYEKSERLITIQAPKELQEIESEFKTRMQDQGVILERVVAENAEMKSLILKQQEFSQKLHTEKNELKQYLDQLRELSLSFAKIIGIIQNNPDAAYALQNGVNEWRKEILWGKYGPGLRDRLIQLDAKQKTV